MTPDRWREVTAVFHAARERDLADRERFLDEACAADTSLRAEVDALLAADGNAGDFGEESTFARVEESPLRPGTTLGPYRIEGLIGAGGMGEVYRALDPRLGRAVALKVLPRQLAADPLRRDRLLKEARSAAALNHPNICTVHEVGQAEGRDYIVFEHIEGQTLAALRAESGLPLRTLVDLFLPLSEALDYAHLRGIVHRDLKPANVMVSALGLPKILDFGVAKGIARPGDTSTATRPTEEGVVMGTAGYMSPEQSLGQPVDARTDVFAFACVLYELASGRRAFDGASFVEITDAVLHKEPEPLSQLRPDLPPALSQIVRKCLRKAPADRYSSMSEVTKALWGVGARRHSPPSWAGLVVRRSASWAGSKRGVSALAGGAAVLVGLVAYALLTGDPAIPRLVDPVQVTVAVSLEDYPSWSPDARTLTYESNESGNWDIWVTQVGGGPPVNRTPDHPGEDRYPSWSPDGRSIAFWSDRDGGGYHLMPALGGSAQRVATTAGPGAPYHSPPQWSTDGKELAYVTYEPAGARYEPFVEIASVTTRDVRRVRLPGRQECRLDLAWSRDGRFLAYVDAAWQIAETTQLRVLRLSDGQSVEITDDRANVRGPTWSGDGRSLYFSANRAGPSDLWQRRIGEGGLPMGEPRQITTAVEVRHAGFSRDETRIAFSKGRWVSNVWRVPIHEDRSATWADAEQVTFDQAYIEFVDVSGDGRRLLFSSDRAGNQDVWSMAIGQEPLRLTSDPAPEWAPRWSPDGKAISFYSSRSGDREIWVMPAAGGAARQLTHAPGLDAGWSWSPDGRSIVFRSERTGNSEIWTIGSDGQGERQLTEDPAGDYGPVFSPDGRWLAFSSTRGGALEVWRMPAEGGAAQRVSRVAAASPNWSSDGSKLFLSAADGPPRLWAISLADRKERVVADLTGRRGSLGLGAPATDGKSLYFPWRNDVGDIWVMDVRPE